MDSSRQCASTLWKHDVFLSFRGRETRQGFVSHLSLALESTGRIKTFKDDQGVEVGNVISPTLLKAIEESRFAVVVLSSDYASSAWCLIELTKILETMKGSDRILPIYYHVEPSHVRFQLGSFAEAFAKHEGNNRQSKEKLDQWRLALENVASLSGWNTKNYRTEGELVKCIVEFISSKLVHVLQQPAQMDLAVTSTEDFTVFEATRQAMDELIKALRDDGITVVGVYGMSGVGKTVMVKHVSAQALKVGIFHKVIMVVVSEFPDLRNIQTQLAVQLELDLELGTENGRAARLKERILGETRILIILDDIWDSMKLSSIGIPSTYELRGCKSKVLFTTRRRSVCHLMQCQASVPLNFLSEEDCLNYLLKKARNSGYKLEDWPMIDRNESNSSISFMKNQICKLPQVLLSSKFQERQNMAGIYEISGASSTQPLRNLDLSFSSIQSPPQSFSVLTNLQGLYLDYCNNMKDIRTIEYLKNLEILSMKKCHLKELPKEIGGLTNLRMLDVSGGYNIGRIPSGIVSRLYNLEELCMQSNFGDWGSKVEGGAEQETNAGFDELTGLRYLNSLRVCISNAQCLPDNIVLNLNLTDFDICISTLSRDYPLKPYFSHDLRRLTLRTTMNSLPDWFINAVTEKAVTLEYLNCKDLNNILVEYDRGRLHELKHLAVIGPHEKLKVLMETITQVPKRPVFKNLEELHLVGLSCLQEFCVGELPPQSLSNLKKIKVEYCHDLVNALLPPSLWLKLQNLEKLTCEHMNGLEYVFGCEGQKAEDLSMKLREMILCDLEKLKSIWYGPAPNAVFYHLRCLAVSGCKSLECLFTYNVAQCLLQLEKFSLTQCPSLDMVIEPSMEARSKDVPHPKAIFPSLKIMAVSGCKNLKSLFILDATQCLLQLEDLSVSECPSLNRVIEPEMEAVNNKISFPELKNLVLFNLPQLTRFYTSGSATIYCPSLQHLHVQDCPQFMTSTSDFHSWMQFQAIDLRHLRISDGQLNAERGGNGGMIESGTITHQKDHVQGRTRKICSIWDFKLIIIWMVLIMLQINMYG